MKFFSRARIALVEIAGIISGPRARLLLQVLRSLRSSGRARAVILDIDSPGGAVTASELLFREISYLSSSRPVIAFIRGIGASGAYLACCAATRIVALPSALVGSIGVISLHPVMPDLLRKLGIRMVVVKGGKFKDMGAFYREPTEEEARKEQELIKEFYEDFIITVARARRLSQDQIEHCATGEIFTARRARELGLVDELGDMERALDLAAELGKVPRRLYQVRPRRPLIERLLQPAISSITESVLAEVERYFSFPIYYR